MSWLNDHLENFVRPVLGYIPARPTMQFFTPEELSVIKSAWRSVKAAADGKKILLAGRDVFIFEVLARRENYETLFLPHCSRVSVRDVKLKDKNVFLFDTGFVGTIPRALGVADFKLLSCTHFGISAGKQIFPKLTGSRHLALKIEGTPKYWETARSVDGKIVQNFSDTDEFVKAAKLTMEIYTNSAPKFIEKKNPTGVLSL